MQRYVTSYAHVAALTLFLNIVIHPLDHRSRDDLEVLTSTGNMIRKMPMLELTKAEIIHLRELNKFVTRLFWLGSSAVVKADKESDQTEQALV
ncbi:hypothetical protein N7539_005100 [Penicillium diatomitis]|uniref:Uncharacterized protein n=1 Tax=Penicillium diatomitis TaxID=2819901 RepID=A0A9W9X6B9_9EURO|nr:uncharacterized protein N7539_005100 [Penicillium diatomitis]KAJ5485112.1 hypothetical protein N7539_005100 [Penicillium diatomitis]